MHLGVARNLHILHDVREAAHLRTELLRSVDLIDKPCSPLSTEDTDDRLLPVEVQLPYGVEVIECGDKVKRRRYRRYRLHPWWGQQFRNAFHVIYNGSDALILQELTIEVKIPLCAVGTFPVRPSPSCRLVIQQIREYFHECFAQLGQLLHDIVVGNRDFRDLERRKPGGHTALDQKSECLNEVFTDSYGLRGDSGKMINTRCGKTERRVLG